MKGCVPWNKGLTKESDPRVKSHHVSDLGRKKISDALKGRHLSEETRRKIAFSHKGKHHSEEHKRKISESQKGRIGSLGMKGKHHSPEARKRISEALKGQSFTEEHKKKMSDAQKGHISWNKGLTKEIDPRLIACSWNKGLTKEMDPRVNNQAEARKGYPAWNKGLRLTDEHKKRCSDALKGLPAWNKGFTKEMNDGVKTQSEKVTGPKCSLYIDGRTKMLSQYRGQDWASIRRQILDRDDHKCDFSNTGECKGRLIVHHLDPYHDNHNNSLVNLITLCVRHHGIVERSNEELPHLLGSSQSNIEAIHI